MKQKFIKFLKENHAFQEYLEEIKPYTIKDLEVQLSDGGEQFLLQDGCIFFYHQATTSINWDDLSSKWMAMLEEKT